ncbi:MAG TPA: antibiotic biosynthesis monooxygenase [Thermoanaerobaculia bacterium]|nr:antibiotic biosynthesis monooxygenase [Thermoanaerobaculia bacterium]
MVGRIWEIAVDPGRAGEFEGFVGEWALPMVRGRMGCSAVHVLRDANTPGRYVWITLWLSRKALAVAAASPEWEEARRRFARFGVSFDLEEARPLEAVASFRGGEDG